jgi:hypothetical protein
LHDLHYLLTRALKKTEALWPAIEQAYTLVHQAAHVLANHNHESAQAVQERYEQVLATIRELHASGGPLSEALGTFLKKTESYWPGLFHCYDIPDLPRTNNDLEHCFGSVRDARTARFRSTRSHCCAGGAWACAGPDRSHLATAVFFTTSVGVR